jgi:hypothetical protein
MGVDARGQAVTTMNDDSAQPDSEPDSAAAGKR